MGEADAIDLEDFRRRFDAIGKQDWDTASALLHPDITWHDPAEVPDAAVHVGIDAVRRFWAEEMFEAWETWRVDVEEMIPLEDSILTVARMRVKAAHSGIETEIVLYQVWTIKDGLITEQRAFFDRDQANEAAGLQT